MLLLFSVRMMKNCLFGEELFVRFTVRVYCESLSVCVCAYFPTGFEGGMWNLIVSVPDHCVSFKFSLKPLN